MEVQLCSTPIHHDEFKRCMCCGNICTASLKFFHTPVISYNLSQHNVFSYSLRGQYSKSILAFCTMFSNPYCLWPATSDLFALFKKIEHHSSQSPKEEAWCFCAAMCLEKSTPTLPNKYTCPLSTTSALAVLFLTASQVFLSLSIMMGFRVRLIAYVFPDMRCVAARTIEKLPRPISFPDLKSALCIQRTESRMSQMSSKISPQRFLHTPLRIRITKVVYTCAWKGCFK